MEQCMQAKTNGVEFSRSGGWLRKTWRGMVWRLELLGRAKACGELTRMGHHETAKNLMLDLTKYK